MELSNFDKSLLNLLQGNLPVCSRPFAAMAATLGVEESFVLERVRELKAAGYLRRIGTFFNSDNLGYRGTLVALEVEPSEICAVAETINAYNEVTHNYEREGKFNLWFTLLTLNTEREQNILQEIKSLRGVEDMINLKSNRKYKINVQFKLQ
ncbi:MAG: AsnC family transcriptional regulator [Selenomonadaceae bacterium]|nr:AsnC family transcriptional regulator [Selenomonadaceae bacterium]